MLDVENQLRGYVEQLDTTRVDVDIEEALEGGGGFTPQDRYRKPVLRQPFRGWAAAVSAVVVLVLLGGVAWFIGSDNDSAGTVDDEQAPNTTISSTESTVLDGSSPSSTIVTPTTEPVPSIDAALIAGQWSRHELLVPGRAFPWVGAVETTSSGYVAVGRTWASSDVVTAQVWVSVDGIEWEALSADEPVFSDSLIDNAVANDQGIVAWGLHDKRDPGAVFDIVIWFSPNGTDWERVVDTQSNIDAPFPTGGIALDNGGFVLYGGSVFDSSVRVSTDGKQWEVIPTPVDFRAMAQLESGDLIAAGGSGSEPTTWISTDGVSWTLFSEDHQITEGFSVQIGPMIRGGPGFVLAGGDTDEHSVLWVSDDGRSFEETLHLPQGVGLAAMAASSEWIVGVGGDGIGGPAIWVSHDGIEWVSIPLGDMPGAFLRDVTYNGTAFVAIGTQNCDTECEPLVLRWQPTSP